MTSGQHRLYSAIVRIPTCFLEIYRSGNHFVGSPTGNGAGLLALVWDALRNNQLPSSFCQVSYVKMWLGIKGHEKRQLLGHRRQILAKSPHANKARDLAREVIIQLDGII